MLIDLSAAIVRLTDNQPKCLVIASDTDNPDRLPFGPFYPPSHRTMEIGLRQWVNEQVGVSLGHVEQLYTFGDRGRHDGSLTTDHVVSVGYLALTQTSDIASAGAKWVSLYNFFPWEDWRDGRPRMLDDVIMPTLDDWVETVGARSKSERVRIAFPDDAKNWDEDLVLERYELLYEAGMIDEAVTDGRLACKHPSLHAAPDLGLALQLDHRRILATAMGRLRSKMKYRPVIFDLMPELFTLGQLQSTAEAILGTVLHKQNFRRLVERSALIESTGQQMRARGRPAELFRFKYEAEKERPLAGLRVGAGRARKRS